MIRHPLLLIGLLVLWLVVVATLWTSAGCSASTPC